MKLSTDERTLLSHMKHHGAIELAGCSGEARRCLIDMGMREPALVEVNGPMVNLTDAGAHALFGENGQ